MRRCPSPGLLFGFCVWVTVGAIAPWLLLLAGCTPKANQAARPLAGSAARPFVGTWQKPGTNGGVTVTYNTDGSYVETGSNQPRPLRSVYDPLHLRALQSERGGEPASLTGRWSEKQPGMLEMQYDPPQSVYSVDRWQVSKDGKRLTLSTVVLNRRPLRTPASPDVYER